MSGEELENMQEESLDSELLGALASAVRPKGDLETLLASILSSSVFLPSPLHRVMRILEGFMLLPLEEQKRIASEEERETISRMYKVALSLNNTVEMPVPRSEIDKFAAVGWCFPPEAAAEHLSFIKNVYRVSEGVDELTSEGPGSLGWRQYLVELYHAFTRPTCPLLLIKMVQGEFIASTMPLALDLLRRMFQQYITRETWQTFIRLETSRGREPL